MYIINDADFLLEWALGQVLVRNCTRVNMHNYPDNNQLLDQCSVMIKVVDNMSLLAC